MSTSDTSGAKRQRTDGAGAGATATDGGGKPLLYSYWRSTCSWRVRIALALKNIEYEYKAVHLLRDGGEQLKEDYAKLNSMKEVPTLKIDGETLTQSMAILEYLDETHPDTNPLLPKEPKDRAKVRALANIIAADTQPVQNLRVLKHVMKTFANEKEKDQVKIEWGNHWITNSFRGLEQELKQTAGKYSYGDQVTIVDLCLVPQVYNAGRFKVDMEEFPTINKVYENLKDLPSFKAAHPENQPDNNT
eukprot:gb/GECG01011122.1/.p1 GENE.gb/GECG01011122.1/~~gb/GECG01011122.1/.p1  ORF type:complete len:247 (+),score=35.99 gb/GECG01011122.1/:1-741(+)